MEATSAFTFAVVCEAPADLRLVSGLADRILCQEVDWISPESLGLHRRWRGLEPSESHLEWHRVGALAKKRNLKAHGHFSGEPGALDAVAARKALLLLAGSRQIPDAVVLVRDTDGEVERQRGLEQARRASPWPFHIALAVVHTKRECWVLHGFEPRSSAEHDALSNLRQDLGFDPRLQAESLTAKEPQALRNAKRVLGLLTSGDSEREQECWETSDLETLRERGQLSGLAEYLQEIQELVVPLFVR